MIPTMILLFVVGYLFIALEHKTRIDKSAVALLMAGAIWTVFSLLGNDPHIQHELVDQLGDTCEILVFLIGAMTIVDLIDSYGGFNVITDHITTRNKRKLMWLLAIITFFMSAALDNMTTTIIMVMLLRRLIANKKERWIFASVIVIAANSGGAWSPIGDVTTIMLWVRGNISTSATIPHLFLPSLVSALVPVLIISRYLHGKVTPPNAFEENRDNLLLKILKANEKLAILCIGVFCLLFVPVFKTVTHLPPFMGILMGVGILWIFTELMYRKTPINEDLKLRLSKVVSRIDGATLMFFLGILLAVDALRCSGVLGSFSLWLDDTIGNVYAVNLIIGTLSAIVDNVPLVAGAIGMYPVASDAMVTTAADPVYMAHFIQDGVFWQFLAYCAGVGGSMLIIGSAAGVVVMGLEGINFIWYLKRISLLALAGYLSGAAVYILQNVLLGI